MLEFSEEEYAQVCCSPVHTPCLEYDAGGKAHVIQEQPQTEPIAMTDTLDNTWCEDCKHRGEFVNWGKKHGYPALEIHPYAIAEGAYYWCFNATQAGEDRVWAFLALIEMLENERGVA